MLELASYTGKHHGLPALCTDEVQCASEVETHAQVPRLGLLPFNAWMCHSDSPRIKDIDATAQLILDLLELCQALLHFLVQLHAAERLGMTVILYCSHHLQ